MSNKTKHERKLALVSSQYEPGLTLGLRLPRSLLKRLSHRVQAGAVVTMNYRYYNAAMQPSPPPTTTKQFLPISLPAELAARRLCSDPTFAHARPISSVHSSSDEIARSEGLPCHRRIESCVCIGSIGVAKMGPKDSKISGRFFHANMNK